ncbi:hypothetical protein ABZ915_24340 [Streptomyces sp. NPDC046915]|uniref:hypothetical protein n=1 Tax=Streptomyces sp. NPDC046915 TaxID=3155257 RepID=UPI0033CC845A
MHRAVTAGERAGAGAASGAVEDRVLLADWNPDIEDQCLPEPLIQASGCDEFGRRARSALPGDHETHEIKRSP